MNGKYSRYYLSKGKSYKSIQSTTRNSKKKEYSMRTNGTNASISSLKFLNEPERI
jgi:hypothetical protein